MNPSLGARHAGSQGWEIVQYLPKVVDHGVWNGSRILQLKKVPHRIMLVPALGSRVFADLKALWGPKFDKKFDEFAKFHKVRTA